MPQIIPLCVSNQGNYESSILALSNAHELLKRYVQPHSYFLCILTV